MLVPWLGVTLLTACALSAGIVLYVAHRFTTPRRVQGAATVPPGCEVVHLRARVDGLRLSSWYAPGRAQGRA